MNVINNFLLFKSPDFNFYHQLKDTNRIIVAMKQLIRIKHIEMLIAFTSGEELLISICKCHPKVVN